MLYPSQHLSMSLEYEPDDFSDKSSRDGEEECSGSRSILLMDDDEEDGTSPAVGAVGAAAPQDMTLWPEAASDISGWTATSSRPSSLAGGADRPSRHRRPRPWDEIQSQDISSVAHPADHTAAAVSQNQSHGLPPTSLPTAFVKDSKKINTQPLSGERTPLLKQQHSSRDSFSSYTTQPTRNATMPMYNSTSGRRGADDVDTKRFSHSPSPTAFSTAQSTAPTVSTFASLFSKLGRRRKKHLHSPPTQFSWSGGFFAGDSHQNHSASESRGQDDEQGNLWSRLLKNEKSNKKSTLVPSHSTSSHHTNNKSKGIHHATFRAAASNHFYQEESYEDVEGPSSFIHTTFLAKKKKRTEWFVSSLSLLMILHFVIMMGYEVLLWYISFRRGQTMDNSNSSRSGGSSPPPPFWLSSEGRIYNPSIGPNPTTLTLFGIFNPALCILKMQYWRFFTSLTLCSNFVQLIVNLIVLITVVSPLEERYGSSTMSFTYVLCAWTGGIMSLLMSCNRNPNIPKVLLRSTTLTCAGLTGIAIVGVIERVFSQTREKVFNRLHSATGKKKSGFLIVFTVDRWGFPHFAVVLGFTNAVFTSFASFESLFGGIIMGACCGVLLFADMLKCLDEDDDEDDTWSTEDDASFAGLSDIDMDRSFAEAQTGSWNEDDRVVSTSNYETSTKSSNHALGSGKSSIHAFDGDDLRLRTSYKTPENDIVHGDASSPLKSPKNAKAHSRSNALGTAGYLQVAALITGLCCLLMPLLLIGMVLWPPSYQSMKDSIHGCVSMHSFYDFSVVDDQQVDSRQPVCGEICTPFGLYRRIPLIAPELILDIGSCSDQGFSCRIMSDFMAIGDRYDLSREVYAMENKGEANNPSYSNHCY